MEGMLHKSLSENIQEETKRQKAEGVEKSKPILSSTDILQVETKNFEINARDKTNNGVNGQSNIDSDSNNLCESENESGSLQEKTYSPTLIESAFKVMKNLFSPDKTKSKSANIISPVKQHQNASISPNNSIYITRKSEFASSESGIENSLTHQTGENSIKNQFNINQGVLYSPLSVESQNNTDESFLTTVSIIDDSFHSAITNLDENGEASKLEENVIDNYLDNSQNLEVGDPYNETSDNSEYCLENTTLRNGSFGLESTRVADISVQSKDGNGEYSNSSQMNGLCNEKALDDTKKLSVDETQSEALKDDDEFTKKSHSGEDSVQVLAPEESSNAIAREERPSKASSPVKNMNMEHLFLNKSFDKIDNNSDSLEVIPVSGTVCEKSSEVIEKDNKKVEVESLNNLKSESCFEVLNYERDVALENTISTTTVVLKSAESVELDPTPVPLDNVSDANSPQVPVAGSASVCSVAVTKKPNPPKEEEYFSDVKVFPNTPPSIAVDSLPESKLQKNKSSFSERDSPGSPSKLNKIKLHKSDEIIHHRLSIEALEGKRPSGSKQASDVPLVKSTEVSKQSPPGPNKPNCGTSELNDKMGVDSKQQHLTLEPGKDTYAATNDPAAVPVFSQLSYTVLNNDKNLNRPVIDSVTVLRHFPEEQTFQSDDLNSGGSAETLILESSTVGNYCNTSLGATHSTTRYQQKQSTPLVRGSGRTSPGVNRRTFAKPLPLNLTSPKGTAHKGKKETDSPSTPSKPDSGGETIQLFNSNEDPPEFSPVNSVNDSELIFLNSVEGVVIGSPCLNVSDPKSTGAVPSKESSDPRSPGKKSRGKSMRLQESVSEPMEAVCNPNQTFSKRLGSPQSHKLNQTFDKKSRSSTGGERLNVTYDKNGGPSSPNITNKTFTKEMERTYQTFYMSESLEVNKTCNKNAVGKGLNQTFDLKTDPPGLQKLNKTFDKSSPPAGQSSQKADRSTSSPMSEITNQTFVKEKDVDVNQQKKDAKETLQEIPRTDGPDLAANVEPEPQAVEEEQPSDKQPQTDKNSAEDIPVLQGGDQQDPDLIDGCLRHLNGSSISGRSSTTSILGSELSTLLHNEGTLSRNQSLDDLAGKLKKLDMNESSGSKRNGSELSGGSGSMGSGPVNEKNSLPESDLSSGDKMPCDPYLVQLIKEQFSSNDIEKICSVVDDISSMKLSSQILKASEQFDKSFHENISEAEVKPDKLEELDNPLSPKSFDFLNSIQGKPTGRDLSRESLYVKFDPLVQPNPNSLIDFTKEGQALAAAEKSPPSPQDSNVCERLLSISPQKKPDDIVPPLTPLSHKSITSRGEDNMVRIKELQNEIYFLKNLYAERERANKAKMEDYESQVAKLTGESCFLEDILKEANEREKSLVKKMKEQNQSLSQLKIIMEEYVKVISKLTAELETLKAENLKQFEALSFEKDFYMTHLQNTEAAFTDIYAKYEKSKKTIVSLKTNEAKYRNTIAEQGQKMEELKARATEAQEKAMKNFEKIQEELSEAKASHNQETARLRAQLRKTELKVEALQESLEQKIKENQQLTAICDELIEGKK